MTEPRSRRRSRLNRTEHHLYTARLADEVSYLPNEEENGETVYLPNDEQTFYTPNEDETADAAYQPNEENYTPNEPEDEYAAYAPNEPDYTAYYSREAARQEAAAEPAFAPPPSMQQYAFDVPEWEEADEPEETEPAANNVYRPRTVTWAEEDRDEAIAESGLGYQVQEDEHAEPVRRKHTLRNCLIVLLALALIGGAAWWMRDEIMALLGAEDASPAAVQETLMAVVTPEPIKPYDAAPAAQVAVTARNTIARLSGDTSMETYLVTENSVVTRSRRADGSYDFYLFASDGRLLCYFEALDAQDMMPQDFGGFYVRQAPWLVEANGSGLIRTSDVEAAIGESVFLHPMYRGWAVVESEADGHANYVNADGQLMSSLWFSRTFPFTGEYTLAYVDTGSTAAGDDRYLLYMLGTDGSMTRWLSAGDMEDAVAAVCGMAYMKDGQLYHLPDTAAAIASSPEVIAYPDCGALVVKDPSSGRYGLFVNGEQHYAYAYDAIHPLPSELTWMETSLGTENAQLIIRTVAAENYPLPLSHSFVLEKDGQQEHVALSTQSSYPIRLDGEF